MQDAFAYCAELVRAADRDRFLASLFAPAEHRDALHALYAFNIEIARVREVAREPLPGEIRLQWWSEVLRGERGGEASANPVAAALLTTIERHRACRRPLLDLIEARRFDLYDEPMAAIADLKSYAVENVLVAVRACGANSRRGDAEASRRPAGMAYAIARLLRAFPQHAARRQLYVPTEMLERHRAIVADIFAGRASPGLHAALAEMRGIGAADISPRPASSMAALPAGASGVAAACAGAAFA